MPLVLRVSFLSWCWVWLAFSSQAQRADSTFAVDVRKSSELHSAAASPQGKVAVLGRHAYTTSQPLAVGTATHHEATLAAYPNPARSQLHLRLDATAGPQTVSLLDALGRPVLTQRVVQPTMSLSTATLPAGMYLLRVTYATGPVTRRVVVE